MAESDAEREARLRREIEDAVAQRRAELEARMQRDREEAEREAAERRAQGNGSG